MGNIQKKHMNVCMSTFWEEIKVVTETKSKKNFSFHNFSCPVQLKENIKPIKTKIMKEIKNPDLIQLGEVNLSMDIR